MIRKLLAIAGLAAVTVAGMGAAVAMGGDDHECKYGKKCGEVVTITVTVPGPTTTVTVPGPTTTVTETVTNTVTTPGPTTTVTVPGPTVTTPGLVTTVKLPGKTVTKVVRKPRLVIYRTKVKTKVVYRVGCPMGQSMWKGKCHAIVRGSG